jgi:alpha-D-ribose 1-methylphosphonate 5-triphosphate synthase subunit PhnG
MTELSNSEISERRNAMRLLARAALPELADPVARLWPNHGARELKPVETGLVMLRGRAGGDGAPFNLGEATVTRAVVELPGGERGYGHILGRDAERARPVRAKLLGFQVDAERARLAAVLDALWQARSSRKTVETCVLGPIAQRLQAERAKADAETASTRVDFFTLVRGEDEA